MLGLLFLVRMETSVGTGNNYFAGNIGIGTAAPGGKLAINYSYNSSSPRATAIYLTDPNNTNMKGYIGMNRNSAAGSNKEYLSVQAVEESVHWMNIILAAEGGNVGIGTTAPSEKLEVNGTIKATVFLYSSDERLKKDINKIDNALEKIQELEGVFFKWKDNDEKTNLGLIAQDVEKVFPEVVQTSEVDGLKSIAYANLVAPLIEAVKEQQEQIKKLEERIKDLESSL